MTFRPLDLLDIPTIHRYRNDALSLDSALVMTRGKPLGPISLLAYLNPTRHIYTAVSENAEERPLMGSITHNQDETFARLWFLAPRDQLDSDKLPELIDHLSSQAGKWEAIHILAEVDERTPAFISLRQAGYSVYAWQRVWDLSTFSAGKVSTRLWEPTPDSSLIAIQSLFQQIVPGLLHAIEPAPKKPVGLICCDQGLKAFASLSYGMSGIVIRPLIHPDVNNVAEKLASLVDHLPDRRNRPVYLCMRSYQAWLEPVLEDLGALAGPRQAVMVKHLAATQRAEQTVPASAEKAWAKPATPIARTSQKTQP